MPITPIGKPAGKPSLLPLLTSAGAEFLKNIRIVVHAPPKHGKSLFANTISKHFKGWPNPGVGVTTLFDNLVIAFDPNALEGLREQGYDAHLLDLSKTPPDKLLPTLNELATALPEMVKSNGIENVIFDTISFLDKMLVSFWSDAFKASTNKFDLYRSVLTTHVRIVDMIKLIDANVIVLCHSKAPGEATDTAQQMKAKAAAMPGSGGLTPDITGQAKNLYEAMASIIIPLRAEKVVDPKTRKETIKRVVYPTGGTGLEGGSRYQRYLGAEEEADLGAMINKIRIGAKATDNGEAPGTAG